MINMTRSYPTVKELTFYKEKVEEYQLRGFNVAVLDKNDLEKQLKNDSWRGKNKTKRDLICETP